LAQVNWDLHVADVAFSLLIMKVMMTILSVAAALKRHSALTLVGGCKVQAPGGVQALAGGGQDGTVDNVAPHMNVFKDGFWDVGCKSDMMVQTGDRFGDNKVMYAEQASANTSIVWYGEVVERDNQKSMTPTVCFDFCRTVPDMQFFGLIHGRDCYCEHYYKTTIGDGVCDLPCDGGEGICGGQSMSSLYQMHSCEGGLQQDVTDLFSDGEAMFAEVQGAATTTQDAGNAMQASGDKLESYAEGSASSLAQEAKVAAGPVVHAADDLLDLTGEFEAKGAEFDAIDIEGELDFETRKQVENLMEDGKALMDAGEQALAAGDEWLHKVSPEVGDSDTGATFVPVMRQVDTEFEAKQSVCGGETTGAPKVGLDYDGCAEACDSEQPKQSSTYCWAFQYITFPDADPLCFLYSDITELTTYNCDVEMELPSIGGSAAFLERKHHKKKKHAIRKSGEEPAAKKEPEHTHRALMASHPSSKFILNSVHFKYEAGKRSASPQAICSVRFSDVNGVTPKFKDGRTDIDRCFGQQ